MTEYQIAYDLLVGLALAILGGCLFELGQAVMYLWRHRHGDDPEGFEA